MNHKILLIFLFAIIGFSCKINSIAKSEKQLPSRPTPPPPTVDCEVFLEAFYKHFSQKDSSVVKIEYQDSTYLLQYWASRERLDCLKGLPIDLVVRNLGDNYTYSNGSGKDPFYHFYRYKYYKRKEQGNIYSLVVEAHSRNMINSVNWMRVSSQGRYHYELRIGAY